MPKTLKKPTRGVTPAGHSWQLQTAKALASAKYSAGHEPRGPQRITRQGKEGVVIISYEQFDHLMVKSRQPKSIVQFFRESPLVGVELDLEPDKDMGPEIEQ